MHVNTPWASFHLLSSSHTHKHTPIHPGLLYMFFFFCGRGNRSTGGKPTQTRGEHANPTQKSNPGPSCCEARVLTTLPPGCPIYIQWLALLWLNLLELVSCVLQQKSIHLRQKKRPRQSSISKEQSSASHEVRERWEWENVRITHTRTKKCLTSQDKLLLK